VRREIKYGSDWIKLLVTGAFQSVGDNPRNIAFSPEELRAAVEEAGRHGVPVAAHAHAAEGIKQAVKAGVRSIEHGTFIDAEAARMMAKRGTFLVPTIYIGDYYAGTGELLAQKKNDDYMKNDRANFLAAIGRAHEAGVKISVGIDLGGYGVDPTVFAREFAILHEAGMTPMEAIQAGTRVNAELLQWEDRLGTIEVGKLADIIAVSFVMIGGKVVRRPGRTESLSGLLISAPHH
jgi:imidazolonepropionase-like amidohydrolase